MADLYDVTVHLEGGGVVSDLVTGSRRYAVSRARWIARAYPWQRQRTVRVMGPRGLVDFNE